MQGDRNNNEKNAKKEMTGGKGAHNEEAHNSSV